MRSMSLAMRTAVIAGIFALSSALTGAAGGEPARAEVQDAAPRHAIAMHGAPKYAPGFTHFDYVNPAAPKGGKVKLSAIGTFDSLNQFIIKGVSAASLGYLYDSLMTGSSDEAFTVYGLLAETIETPEDRSWVAFTLRPEARFNDGTPVTVDDVIFSFNILRDKGSPFFAAYYGNVVKVEKTAARRVKFSFKPGKTGNCH